MEFLVIGPMGRQVVKLQSRYPSVRIRVCSKTRNPTYYASVSRVLVATRFVNHHQQIEAIRAYGRAQVSLIPGGLSSLAREIERLMQ